MFFKETEKKRWKVCLQCLLFDNPCLNTNCAMSQLMT